MDRSEICDKFLDSLEFDLYPFQEEALLAWFEAEGGVLIAAPTGMGKTLIAEAAIFEALHTGTKLYYTTPLIALTDQKFREFQDAAERWGFPRESVGLMTGNRKINPDATIRVVVAEILLNHILSEEDMLTGVSGVVMDEFHYFNSHDRGIVWELSLSLLPHSIRLMLLSATVGNSVEFTQWGKAKHDRQLTLIQSNERRVPLEYIWVGDKLLTEHLVGMVSDNDADNRSPALVFCFSRDECWDVAERLKGLKLINEAARNEIEQRIPTELFLSGIGPKLRQMLIRGVGVHHAGILPKYKEVIENLFLAKLTPFVVCTETLAAGINLPARSVVINSLLKGKPREKKLIPSSDAHQMFGRAGRPQFDTSGYVYAMAHEDDVKIAKWHKKYEKIDPKSKDPNLMRAKKQLERKKPKRRTTQQYWAEGQLDTLVKAGPAKLHSRSMIPYQILIYLITQQGSLAGVRDFLSKRFNEPARLEKFQSQLDCMIANLAKLGYLTFDENDDSVTLNESIHELKDFRSVDPLFGAFLVKQLSRGQMEEKLEALESVLPMPPAVRRAVAPMEDRPASLLEIEVLTPQLLTRGLALPHPEGGLAAIEEDLGADYMAEDYGPRRIRLPEMLRILFESHLASPEIVIADEKWIAGGIIDLEGDFEKFVRTRNLLKNEGLVLRHLLRLVILAGEFHEHSAQDPDYKRIEELVTQICQSIDPRYTDRFLESDAEAKNLAKENQ